MDNVVGASEQWKYWNVGDIWLQGIVADACRTHSMCIVAVWLVFNELGASGKTSGNEVE
jgi:hypothetical protein